MSHDAVQTVVVGEWQVKQYAAQCTARLPRADFEISLMLWSKGDVSIGFTYKNPSSLTSKNSVELGVQFDDREPKVYKHEVAVPMDSSDVDPMRDVDHTFDQSILTEFSGTQRIRYFYKGRLIKEVSYESSRLVVASIHRCIQKIYDKDPFVD